MRTWHAERGWGAAAIVRAWLQRGWGAAGSCSECELRAAEGSSDCAGVSSVPASIPPPGPHHQCWSSRCRVIRPRLYPHRNPHRRCRRRRRRRSSPRRCGSSSPLVAASSLGLHKCIHIGIHNAACHPSPLLSSPHPPAPLRGSGVRGGSSAVIVGAGRAPARLQRL